MPLEIIGCHAIPASYSERLMLAGEQGAGLETTWLWYQEYITEA